METTLNPIEANKELSELEAGDWVIYGSRRNRKICQISRTTNTMLFVNIPNYANALIERKFHKKNGYEVGGLDSYDIVSIKPYKKEVWDKIIADRIFSKVAEKLPLVKRDTANEVYGFLLSHNLITPIEKN